MTDRGRSAGGAGAAASREVTLAWPDGRTRTIAVRGDETILEAAERADIALPFGCRTGACGTCAGRLLEASGAETADAANGDADAVDRHADVDAVFDYRRPPRALKDRHHAAGYVLLCIASPRVDCRIAVGSGMQSELVDNPWK